MKAYKIFENDWTCTGFQYKVGKTYKIEGELIMCVNGFHACKNLEDCFQYYPCVQWQKIAEVELFGEILGMDDDKQCASEITIIKEIAFEDIGKIIKDGVSGSDGVNRSRGVNESEGVNLSDGVNESMGVNWSYGVNGSYGVSGSKGVNWSDGVSGSKGVNRSRGVNESMGVNWSYGVNGSYGVSGSKGVNWSDGVSGSKGVNRSRGVNGSYGVNLSEGVSGSNGVSGSDGVYRSDCVNLSKGVSGSYGIFNCQCVSNALFLANKKQEYTIFGKEVTEERFNEVKEKLTFIPEFNNLKELYIKNGREWKKTPICNAEEIQKEEAWSKMPKEQLEYIKSLPEFDADMFFEITGLR